ncbi:MAG: AhpC/TSA family protein [Dysgonamonadaceae bacterium]|jgi:peroxiredoxin|nr:AhpC/TSA family protein [Dysgonamonadaceae bacterium]
MKKLILLAGMTFLFVCCSNIPKNGYLLEGKIGNLTDGTEVYLNYDGEDGPITDTAYVVKNKFVFSDTISEPFYARIYVNGEGRPDFIQLFVEKGKILVSSPDSLKNAVVKNSKLNDENKIFQDAQKSIDEAMAALQTEYREAPEEMRQEGSELMNRLNAAADSINTLREGLAKDFFDSHHDSYISLLILPMFAGYSPEPAFADSLFSQLSPSIQATKEGKKYAAQIEVWKNTSVGAVAPNFTQNTPDGKPVSLSDFKGKYVLIDFWASWCGPCRGENPNVVKAYKQFKDKGFDILGVSLDNGERGGLEKWKQAIVDDGLVWTQVSDLKYWNNDVVKLYGIRSIPANFLLDPDGKIIAKNLRGEDLTNKLQEILK